LEIIKLSIDNKQIEAKGGTSLLEAALGGGIYIPHLCHHPDLSPIGACRLCLVEVEGMEGLLTSCTTAVSEGMVVRTKSDAIDRMRRLAMELMLAGHQQDCTACVKYLNCELQSLKQYLACDHLSVKRRSKLLPTRSTNPLFVQDSNKCILCGRCVRACRELRGVGVLFYKKEGNEAYIGTEHDLPLAESGCRFCGACAEVCPTGAIMDKGELTKGKSRKAALVPCRHACPAEIDVPRYLRFIKEKNYAAAVAVIREKVPFPKVLGYVCDHPCEAACRRGEVNQSVSIRDLKRFAAGHDEEALWKASARSKAPTEKKVAVIGSGPAGLTAAHHLNRQGHKVIVFEALPFAGGMLRYGIPSYRLPRDVLEDEIREIEKEGVEIRTGTRIESIDALFADGFDAVLVAVGAHKGTRLNLPGANGTAVLINTDFLRDVNEGKTVTIGKRVVVLGGGNVAFDCARVARRLGADEVSIACLEGMADLPAADDEIDQGGEEGITFYPSRTFMGIARKDGGINGIECLEVSGFSFDEEGNPEIETIGGSRHIIEADTVIFAIGQKPDIPTGFGIDTTSRGLVELDTYTQATNRDAVFAAGDAVTGTASVVKAIASGRKAATAIDRFLGGRGDIDEKLAPVSKLGTWLGPDKDFARMSRCEQVCLLPDERVQGFCEVVGDMDEETANSEAKRCLQCDLRLAITPVKFWGSY
jgi:NADPH-dependent glutamate synthase beta subunit-like oxidoreductase/Pyruvate/2-oxoacid:ferredoxin oxidoreductase delta subunit